MAVIVKVRRVGNSNVISLPRELENQGFAPGATVLIDTLPTGELRVSPAVTVRRISPERARQLVEQHHESLALLAEDDGVGIQHDDAVSKVDHTVGAL